jgi:hypothetical protein
MDEIYLLHIYFVPWLSTVQNLLIHRMVYSIQVNPENYQTTNPTSKQMKLIND